MKKLICLLLALFIFQCPAWADTWTASFSGSLTINGINNHEMVFPGTGLVTIRCNITGSGGVIVAMFVRSGTTIASKSGSTVTTLAFDPIQVFPNETYILRMYCPYGSNGYTASVSLSYTANSAPVIASAAANPTSVAYGNSVAVSMSATDPDGNLSYVEIQRGTTPEVHSTASSASYTYSGLAAGDYNVAARAVDTQGKSVEQLVPFTITRRSLTVRALGGQSVAGTTPTASQGLQLVSGSLYGSDTIQSIGLVASPTITSSTPAGTYTISILGDPQNYAVSRLTGTWVITDTFGGGIVDADGDGIDDHLESEAFGNSNYGFSSFFTDSDGDGYLDFLDSTVYVFSNSNTLRSTVPGSQSGGPLIVLPDRGFFEISTSTLILNDR
jgi:hypothetical protein